MCFVLLYVRGFYISTICRLICHRQYEQDIGAMLCICVCMYACMYILKANHSFLNRPHGTQLPRTRPRRQRNFDLGFSGGDACSLFVVGEAGSIAVCSGCEVDVEEDDGAGSPCGCFFCSSNCFLSIPTAELKSDDGTGIFWPISGKVFEEGCWACWLAWKPPSCCPSSWSIFITSSLPSTRRVRYIFGTVPRCGMVLLRIRSISWR